MPHPSIRTHYAVELITQFGLSPQERFSLATALLCQCAEQANEECSHDSGNPFRDVPMNKEKPFETAILVLQAFVEFMDRKEAERNPEQAHADPELVAAVSNPAEAE